MSGRSKRTKKSKSHLQLLLTAVLLCAIVIGLALIKSPIQSATVSDHSCLYQPYQSVSNGTLTIAPYDFSPLIVSSVDWFHALPSPHWSTQPVPLYIVNQLTSSALYVHGYLLFNAKVTSNVQFYVIADKWLFAQGVGSLHFYGSFPYFTFRIANPNPIQIQVTYQYIMNGDLVSSTGNLPCLG